MSESKTTTETGTGDALSSALGAMLSNPEMLGVISSLAKELKEGSQPQAEAKEPEIELRSSPPAPENDMSALVGKLAPLLSGASSAGSKKEDDRACLLRALKPYLSEGRSEAIDYIIKFSVLAKALKNLS